MKYNIIFKSVAVKPLTNGYAQVLFQSVRTFRGGTYRFTQVMKVHKYLKYWVLWKNPQDWEVRYVPARLG